MYFSMWYFAVKMIKNRICFVFPVISLKMGGKSEYFGLFGRWKGKRKGKEKDAFSLEKASLFEKEKLYWKKYNMSLQFILLD